jgi:RNA polymerase sigma-70 factor (ECF subfamily)
MGTTAAPRQKPKADRSIALATPSKDDPEVTLMLRVQRGDPGAFALLVERYWPRVFGRLCRWLGDREEAEDLTQEVFLRLYRYRTRYQPRAKFATWLYHVTQNVARNAVRSRRRKPCVRLEALAVPEEGTFLERLLPDRSESPSRPLERAELACRVRSAVKDLGHRQRLAVELHQFADRTYSEIAAEMDMSPKAAKSLLYRARNQLRETLGALVEG